MKRRIPFLSVLLLLPALTLLSSGATFLRRRPPPPPPLPPSSASAREVAAGDLLRLASLDVGAASIASDASLLLNATLDSFSVAGGRFLLLYLRLRPSPTNSSSVAARPRTLSRLRLPVSSVERPPSTNDLLSSFRHSLTAWLSGRRPPLAAAMHDLLPLIKRPIDLHAGRPYTGRRFPTCAVVGNSGVLLGAGHGAFIDAHDFVVRLNNARVAGYASDVGEKSSLSFVNSNILHLCTRISGCDCHPYGDSVPIAMYICQPAHFLDYLVCNASHHSPLLITDARFDALCARIAMYYSLQRFVKATGSPAVEWRKKHNEKLFHYSSGLQAIVLALGICDKVSAFGFGKAPGAKHHYHTNQRSELDLHDYEAEYEFYRDLVARPQVIPFLGDAGFRVPPVVFYR